MKRFAFISCIGLLAFASANAQEFSRYSVDLGMGFSTPAGAQEHYLDYGWNIRGGAGVNFSPYVGVMLNLGYDDMGMNGAVLSNIGVSGGDVHLFHATIDPVVHLTPHGPVDFYLTGGGGVFHRFQEFSAQGTTSAYVPYFGILSSGTGANSIPTDYAVNKPGFDVGGGVAVRAFGHGKVFIEAKWEHMFLNGANMDILPVTAGFRW
jgi:hypothetical protein